MPPRRLIPTPAGGPLRSWWLPFRSSPRILRRPATFIDPSDFFLHPPADYRWGTWDLTAHGVDERSSVLGAVSSSEPSLPVHVTHHYLVQPEGVAISDTLVVPVAYRALFWPEPVAEPKPCDPGMSLFARPSLPGEDGPECILYRRVLVPTESDAWPSDPWSPSCSTSIPALRCIPPSTGIRGRTARGAPTGRTSEAVRFCEARCRWAQGSPDPSSSRTGRRPQGVTHLFGTCR
jgi:hypothetical protein